MATKDHFLSSSSFTSYSNVSENQKYSNLNLNQNHTFSKPKTSFPNGVNIPPKVIDYAADAGKSNHCLSTFFESPKSNTLLSNSQYPKKCNKKIKSTSTSTLFLHIKAKENEEAESVKKDGNIKSEVKNMATLKSWKNVKKNHISSNTHIQTKFELPRQQNENQISDPEVMQFKASQQLFNPNGSSGPTATTFPFQQRQADDFTFGIHPLSPPSHQPSESFQQQQQHHHQPHGLTAAATTTNNDDEGLPQLFPAEVSKTQKGRPALFYRAYCGDQEHVPANDDNEDCGCGFLKFLEDKSCGFFYCSSCKEVSKAHNKKFAQKSYQKGTPTWRVSNGTSFIDNPLQGHLEHCRPMTELKKQEHLQKIARKTGAAINGDGVENSVQQDEANNEDEVMDDGGEDAYDGDGFDNPYDGQAGEFIENCGDGLQHPYDGEDNFQDGIELNVENMELPVNEYDAPGEFRSSTPLSPRRHPQEHPTASIVRGLQRTMEAWRAERNQIQERAAEAAHQVVVSAGEDNCEMRKKDAEDYQNRDINPLPASTFLPSQTDFQMSDVAAQFVKPLESDSLVVNVSSSVMQSSSSTIENWDPWANE